MLSNEQIAAFLTGNIKHDRYEQAVKLRNELLVHTRGNSPAEILNTARPNEELIHKEYRLCVFEPITKAAAGKVITQTAKIQRSQGFGITFPKDSPKLIRPNETLPKYLEESYPVYDSVLNYLFQGVVRSGFEDPNGLLVVIPKEYETAQAAAAIKDGDYLKPFPYIFNSGEVLDFLEGQYAVILKDERVKYKASGKEKEDGKQYVIVDNVNYYFFKQTGVQKAAGNKEIPIFETRTYAHNLAYLPAWQLGSNDIEKQYPGYNLYNSFLSPCLPNWRQAIRSFSDHQVNQVMHIHPEKWYKTSTECKTCNTKGTVQVKDGGKTATHECGNCKGKGYVLKVSPMEAMVIAPYKQGLDTGTAFYDGDPAGYIAKPTNDMEFIKAEYKDQITQGLDAIGLAFIESPLNQSGKAKEYDRQEINTFFYAVAVNLANVHLYNIIYFTNELRYGFVDPKQRDEYFKGIKITVPTQFDVVGADFYYQQYVNAQVNKDDAEIVASKALEYGRVEFGEDSPQYKTMQAKYDLDPLPGLSPEQKLDYRASGECTPEDYIVSNQIYAFIKRAVAEDPAFFEKSFEEKRAKLYQYAEAQKVSSLGNRLGLPLDGSAGAAMATPNNVEAEAKARLKGSVGGTQGILQIQESVASGVTQYEAAVALLFEIYGFDDATARKLLGNPAELKAAEPQTGNI